MQFTTYDRYGRIAATGDCSPESYPLQRTKRLRIIEGRSDPATDWVKGRQIVRRPEIDGPRTAQIRADDADTFVLSGLPKACAVVVDGQPYRVRDGVFELTAQTPGAYVIEIDHWPYLPFRAEVIAS